MSEHISTSVTDGVGRLTLQRPQALNALSYEMIRSIAAVFEAWRHDSEVATVVLDGAGERGFCAGGDVRELYGYTTGGHEAEALRFFRDDGVPPPVSRVAWWKAEIGAPALDLVSRLAGRGGALPSVGTRNRSDTCAFSS